MIVTGHTDTRGRRTLRDGKILCGGARKLSQGKRS